MEHSDYNYIYWIFIAIALVSSFFSKKKKKVDETTKMPVPPVVRMPWERDEEKAPQEIVRPEAVVSKKKVHDIQSFLNEAHTMHAKSVAAVHTDQVKKPPLTVIEEDAGHVEMPDFSNFDAVKRGIIFSEIFSKKYI